MIEINKPVAAVMSITAVSQIILLFLKIENIIDWNWVWVIVPMWAPYVLLLLFGFFTVLYLTIYNAVERIFKKHE
jgi:hypothetical protein